MVLKDTSEGDSKNRGVTWAFEVANKTMVCPIIVEDMSPPGQMLIEVSLGMKVFVLSFDNLCHVNSLGLFCCRCFVRSRVSSLR